MDKTPYSMFYHKIITIIEILIIIIVIVIMVMIMIIIIITIIINDFTFSNNPVFSLLEEVSHNDY